MRRRYWLAALGVAVSFGCKGGDWEPQVVLLSRHGAIGHDINSCDDNGICIQGTLAGTDSCDPDAAPAESARRRL